MDTPLDHSHRTWAAERLDGVMEIACRLAGTDAIGSIHVAIQERPTYDELVYYRSMAEAHGLSLTLKADTIVLRPPATPGPRPSEHLHALALGAWLPEVRVAVRRAAAVVHRLRVHALTWNAGFQGVDEGTRRPVLPRSAAGM